MQKITHTPSSYPANTPYTPGLELINGRIHTLYVSGQGTRNPQTGEKYVGDDIEEQMRFALTNLQTVVEASGFSMSDVVKTTLFVTSLENLPAINKLYASFFNAECLPARSTVMVSGLPGGMTVEIEAMAVKEEQAA